MPGVVWLPTPLGGSRPLVMLGHGGGSNKHSARNRRLARLLNAAGMTAMAIDGPFHGERVSSPMPPPVYQQLIVDEGVSAVTDRMTADWQASLTALEHEHLIGAEPVGYIGLSMGGRYGLPLAAALGSRLGAAVIGQFGLQQTPLIDARLHRPSDIRRAAQSVVAPTLIHVQWHDEVFPRAGQLDLFGVIGAHDKRLLAYPGPHAGAPREAERDWVDFVTTQLVRVRHDPGQGDRRGQNSVAPLPTSGSSRARC